MSPCAQRDPAPHPCEPERLSGASPQTRMGRGWNSRDRRPGRQQGLARRLLGGARPATSRQQRCGRDPGAGALAGRRRRLPGGDGGFRRLRADRASRALAQGVLAAIVNPKRVRDFARGMGLEAKTDRVDARLIARYGEVMRPAATPAPDPARAELGEILACRRQLIDEITVRRQQLEHLQSPAMRDAGRPRPWPSCARRRRSSTKLLRQRSRPTRHWPPTSRCSTSHARLRPDPGRHPAGRDARAGHASTAARSRPSPASPRSPATAACARTAASSRAAAARSAAPSTWPPSPRCGSRPARSRPATPSSSPKAKPPKLALTALMRKMLVTLNAMLKARQAWKHPREA